MRISDWSSDVCSSDLLCNVPIGNKQKLKEMRDAGLAGAIPFSHLNGVFESNRKVSMATLIAAFNARAVIADAKAMINEGNAVVLQLQNTYEDPLNPAPDRLAEIRRAAGRARGWKYM